MTNTNKKQTISTTVDTKTHEIIQEICKNCRINVSELLLILISEGLAFINKYAQHSYVETIKQFHRSTFIQIATKPTIKKISTTVSDKLYHQITDTCHKCGDQCC